VADLAAGNFTAVEGKFDPAMMKAARTVPLQKAWTARQDVLGTYRSHGASAFARKGQFDLEQVPVDGQRAGRAHHHLQPRRDHCRVALRSAAVLARREGRAAPGARRSAS
jgi:hypothetical protein